MNCAEAGDVLGEYLYHDLTPTQRDDVDAHLANCCDCAEQLRQMQAATRWLDRAQTPLPQPLSPVPLLVRHAGELRRRARRWRRGAVAAAAIAATLLLAIASIDHVRWDDNAFVIDFGRSDSTPAMETVHVDTRVSERLRRAESSINVLNESISQLAQQQRRLVTDVQQAMEGTNLLTGGGTVPANEWLVEVGLGPDDF